MDSEKGDEEEPEQTPASEQAPADDEFHTALPPKVESWRKRSATGAILTGLALGLQEALEKEREDPSIVMETSGEPPKDLPVEADFEFRRPRHSVVNIRPWLIERNPQERPTGANAAEDTDPAGAAGEPTDAASDTTSDRAPDTTSDRTPDHPPHRPDPEP